MPEVEWFLGQRVMLPEGRRYPPFRLGLMRHSTGQIRKIGGPYLRVGHRLFGFCVRRDLGV